MLLNLQDLNPHKRAGTACDEKNYEPAQTMGSSYRRNNMKVSLRVLVVVMLLAGCLNQEQSQQKSVKEWEEQATGYERTLHWVDAAQTWEKAAELRDAAGNEEQARNDRMKAALNWEVAARQYETRELWGSARDAWERAAALWTATGEPERARNAQTHADEARKK